MSRLLQISSIGHFCSIQKVNPSEDGNISKHSKEELLPALQPILDQYPVASAVPTQLPPKCWHDHQIVLIDPHKTDISTLRNTKMKLRR